MKGDDPRQAFAELAPWLLGIVVLFLLVALWEYQDHQQAACEGRGGVYLQRGGQCVAPAPTAAP